jgi:hypothetical protein
LDVELGACGEHQEADPQHEHVPEHVGRRHEAAETEQQAGYEQQWDRGEVQ